MTTDGANAPTKALDRLDAGLARSAVVGLSSTSGHTPGGRAPVVTLVVEDDPVVAAIHARYVAKVDGFVVAGVARTGAEALAAADRLGVQLVLLDLYLPDMSGLEVARQLRSPDRRPVDVIVVTGSHDVAAVRDAMQRGVLHYLVKPVTFAALRERLERYAALARQLSAPRRTDQAEVDRLFQLLHTQAGANLPKGLSAVTLEQVTATLQDAEGDLSAEEVAKATGVSRVTARRYLEHLADRQVVQVTLRYGQTGRPQHRYRLPSRQSAQPQ